MSWIIHEKSKRDDGIVQVDIQVAVAVVVVTESVAAGGSWSTKMLHTCPTTPSQPITFPQAHTHKYTQISTVHRKRSSAQK